MSVAPKSQPAETISAARFSITIDGVEIASFSELSGISSEVEPTDHLEASGTGPVISRLPGRRIPPTVVLKRGKNASLQLWAWHEAVVRGDVAARKGCSLVMYNYEDKPVARYHLEQAWPSKLEIGAARAGANEVLMETVTIVCENLQRVTP